MTSCRANDYGLSGNALKIIAALSMLIDHIGVILLSDVAILRIIGRIAFPIYAFMISEGCAYTKNRLRYFLSVFSLGACCQIVYYIYAGSTHMNILITFSISILVVYSMQYFKATIFDTGAGFGKQFVATFVFILTIVAVCLLNSVFRIDYGLCGCLAPAFASIFRKPRSSTWTGWEKLDNRILHVLMLAICLIIASCVYGGVQPYSLLAIPLLMLYSGKRGKLKMKYFFYIFYPSHIIVLECISYFLSKG